MKQKITAPTILNVFVVTTFGSSIVQSDPNTYIKNYLLFPFFFSLVARKRRKIHNDYCVCRMGVRP